VRICRTISRSIIIFNGIEETSREDMEEVLHDFLKQELGVDFHFEFRNVHRFRKRFRRTEKKNPRRQTLPIVAKFIYQKDVSFVLNGKCQTVKRKSLQDK
jgi:hypothetical protein